MSVLYSDCGRLPLKKSGRLTICDGVHGLTGRLVAKPRPFHMRSSDDGISRGKRFKIFDD